MLPIYFVIGLINIFVKHNNYGIKIRDPNFDVRVRRSIQDTAIEKPSNIHNNIENYMTREKRYAYYKTNQISDQIPRYDYTNGNYNNNNLQNRNSVTQNNGINNNENLRNHRPNNNMYTLFNTSWHHLFETDRNNRNNGNNNSGVNGNSYPGRAMTNSTFNGNNGFQGQNINNVYSRSYPYGYPTGYGPKRNVPGYNNKTTTPGYTNANININSTPYFYNYQNPKGQNFAGYYGYKSTTPGYKDVTTVYNNYNNVPSPYAPGYTTNPVSNINNNNLAPWNNNFTNILAPYPPGYTQKPVTNIGFNNNSFIPGYNNFNNVVAPYTVKPGNNSGFNNLTPYASEYIPNPGNKGEYIAYNSASTGHNNIPDSYIAQPGFNNNNLAPNAPGYIPNPSNTTEGFANNTTTPGLSNNSNGNTTETTTEKTLTGCVICHIQCPKFMRRFGRLCVRDDDD